MRSSRLNLRPVRVEDESSFREAVAAFIAEEPPFIFAFDYDDAVPFKDYVAKLDGWSRGVGVPEQFVPATFLVGVVDGVIVGRVSIRHRLNDFLERIGGHVGYGIVPKHRRRGYAVAMLKQALPICKSLGIRDVLITCDVDNVGSRKVIERCGGIFEGITDEPELEIQKRKYWIRAN
ncbi:MAG: GNAT family N-acetyltransferase [Pontiellaceae bacterium]|nr:GNAT family N-acetyltransferase [Pontiellaceae bacterium]